MAMYKSTQTHPKFTFLFFAVRRADLSASPQRIKVIAHSEREARLSLVADFVLSFAGRIPVRGGDHE